MQRYDLKNSTIKLFLVMILNIYLYSEWSQSKSVLWWLCCKGDIGCPFYTSCYDSLGPSWNGLGGCVKQHSFYLVKNSSVHSDSFWCISLYMIMITAHPAPLFHGRANVISKQSLKNIYTVKNMRLTTSGSASGSRTMGTDPSLRFNILTKPALNCPSFRKKRNKKIYAN